MEIEKQKSVFLAIAVMALAVSAYIGLAHATAGDYLPIGSNVKALVYGFSSRDMANGEIIMDFEFAVKGATEINSTTVATYSIGVPIDPAGTLTQMKSAVNTALLNKATEEGLNLVVADIMMPSYIKGN